MKANEFVEKVISDIEANKDAFIANAKDFSEEKTFCEWMKIFIKWSEWSTEEDCKRYHPHD